MKLNGRDVCMDDFALHFGRANPENILARILQGLRHFFVGKSIEQLSALLNKKYFDDCVDGCDLPQELKADIKLDPKKFGQIELLKKRDGLIKRLYNEGKLSESDIFRLKEIFPSRAIQLLYHFDDKEGEDLECCKMMLRR